MTITKCQSFSINTLLAGVNRQLRHDLSWTRDIEVVFRADNSQRSAGFLILNRVHMRKQMAKTNSEVWFVLC